MQPLEEADFGDNVVSITKQETCKIIGRRTAPQLPGGGNPDESIDLEDYTRLPEPVLEDANGKTLGNFIGYELITKEEIMDPIGNGLNYADWKEKFYQPDIKQKELTQLENDVKEMQRKLRVDGFSTKYPPPSGYRDSKENLIWEDGRTRTVAAVSEDTMPNQKDGLRGTHVPMAMFKICDSTTDQELRIASIMKNDHPLVTSKWSMETFVNFGLGEIRRGECLDEDGEVDKDAVEELILQKSGIRRFTTWQQTQTKVINQIMAQALKPRGTEDCKWNRELPEVHDFLNGMAEIPGKPDYRKYHKGGNIEIVHVGDKRSDRLLCKIFEGPYDEKNPLKIIFFHSEKYGNKAVEALQNYIYAFEDRYKTMLRNTWAKKGIILQRDEYYYNILGCAPCIAGAHDEYYNGYDLVPLDKY